LNRPDKGFIGKCNCLEIEMGFLLNTLPFYMNETKNLANRIESLGDIGEYNNYMRQRIDESALIEEEILVLNQNQPSLVQMNILFSQQNRSLTKSKLNYLMKAQLYMKN
jgi:hypothetical protein